MAPSMDPEIAGLGLNLAAEGKFKAGEAASILGTTSAVMSLSQFLFALFSNRIFKIGAVQIRGPKKPDWYPNAPQTAAPFETQ